MKSKDEPLLAIPDLKVRALLSRLHAQADRERPRLLWPLKSLALPLLLGRKLPWARVEHRVDDKFLSLDRSQGVLCYLLARALGARRIVEFGTSFGISTIYLALAVRDNGGGIVYGTEKVPSKAARARAHLGEAGLLEQVEILEGDARETLRAVEGPVDFLLNDGFPRFALDVLQTLAPKLRPGALVVTDNVGAFRADYADYVAWIRDPANGFCSSLLALNEGTEISVRVAGTLPGVARASA